MDCGYFSFFEWKKLYVNNAKFYYTENQQVAKLLSRAEPQSTLSMNIFGSYIEDIYALIGRGNMEEA